MRQVLFLTDIFPTGYTGIDWANVRGGEIAAIFGAGPVGIMAAKSAWLRGAARVIIIDTQQYRLDKAKQTANAEGILWESHKAGGGRNPGHEQGLRGRCGGRSRGLRARPQPGRPCQSRYQPRKGF